MKSGSNIVAQALPGRNHIFKLLSAYGLKIGDNKTACCNDAHYGCHDTDKGGENGLPEQWVQLTLKVPEFEV
jgi:hypothetical protein